MNVWENLKKNWFVIAVIVLCFMAGFHFLDIKINEKKVKEVNQWINANAKDIPVHIPADSEDMVGITIHYPSGGTRRVIISVELRDKIMERQLREQDISDLIPKDNEGL